MKLLVIEDEVKLAEYLRKGLTESGYVVDVAHDGIDGLHLAMEGGYDLLVLDSMLPGIDGLTLLAALRKSKQTPVLMLTARVHVDDRVRGLQGGADDYLTKPFAFSELTARIQVLLRRAAPAQASAEPTVYRVGDLEVDLLRRKATRAGQRLDLTAKEFNLLALMLRRRGEVLSRTELAAQVWDMNYDSETNVVEVAIRRLRNSSMHPSSACCCTPFVAWATCLRTANRESPSGRLARTKVVLLACAANAGRPGRSLRRRLRPSPR